MAVMVVLERLAQLEAVAVVALALGLPLGVPVR
jgi:hypothetical protein